jgi:hypothetical protein
MKDHLENKVILIDLISMVGASIYMTDRKKTREPEVHISAASVLNSFLHISDIFVDFFSCVHLRYDRLRSTSSYDD